MRPLPPDHNRKAASRPAPSRRRGSHAKFIDPDRDVAGRTPARGGADRARNDSICQRDMKADLFFLAGDRFRGRLTATPENDLASEFIASRFERLGLKRVGDGGSYFHRFNLMTASLGPSNRLRFSAHGAPGVGSSPARSSSPCLSAHRRGRWKTGWLSSGSAQGPEQGHDDYRGAGVGGKIVLVLDHEPGENDPKSPFDGVVMSEAATQWRKALAAQDQVPSASCSCPMCIITRNPRTSKPSPARLAREAAAIRATCSGSGRSGPHPRRPDLDRAGSDLARGRRRARSRTWPARRRSGREGHRSSWHAVVKLSTDVRRHIVPDRNVLAALEGSDPKLKDEWVVISCHHDHNGADGDQVFNGADDNGSGVVGLVEIAEAYALAAKEGHRPKRSILFVSFNSEERGLLGSWAFVEHPPVPLDRIVAVLNMDMVGRDEEVPEGAATLPRIASPIRRVEPQHRSTCWATAEAARSPRSSTRRTPPSA